MELSILLYSVWAGFTFFVILYDKSFDDFAVYGNLISSIFLYIVFPGALIYDVLYGVTLLLLDKPKFPHCIKRKDQVKALEEKIDLCMQNIINLQDELYHTKEELKEIQNYICVNDMKGE